MKIFYILSIILLMGFQVRSQDRAPSSPDREPIARIVKFYPNPATTFITFDFQQNYNENYNLQIINFVGKKVQEVSKITPKTIVNLTDFYRGIYIFQLRDKNGKLIDSGKFQVSK
jgi:Secretion system C-terminal sorting domain